MARKKGSKNKDFKWSDWREMTEKQKNQQSVEMAIKANRDIKALRKKGYDTYALREVEEFFKRNGINNFSKSKKLSGARLNAQLEMLDKFFEYETSSVRGANSVYKRIINNLKDNGVKTSRISKPEFMQFIHSKQFNQLRRTIDSTVLLEDTIDAMQSGYDIKQIMEQYEEHLRNALTLDQIQERRGNVRLLH